MKRKSLAKAPRKAKAKPSPKRKKVLTPEQVACEVRAQLAPAIAPLGVIANTVQFLNRIERMAATLAVWGPKINLTAHPREPDEIVFHVFDSIIPVSIAASARILRLDRVHRVLDIGSGAGFPGLVLAAAINAHVTLVEARRKRATYLSEAAIEMGLQNVRVECARAESLDLHETFDLVTSRAVGDPIGLIEIAGKALHREGGVLMLYLAADQRPDDKTDSAAASAGLVDGIVSAYDLRHGKQVMRRAAATWTRR
ncbi:MAG: 16S rRNA (guanine(527)-N(7))-methyltransferase RsmG [Candidatus Binatus sp.]